MKQFFCLFGLSIFFMNISNTTGEFDLAAFLPTNTQDIKKMAYDTRVFVRDGISQIINQKEPRTFDTIFVPLDRIYRRIAVTSARLKLLALAHPDGQMRLAARRAFRTIHRLAFNVFYTNPVLCRFIKEYSMEQKRNGEKLSADQKDYLDDLIKTFEQKGALLPAKKRVKVRQLFRELTKLTTDFIKTISSSVPVLLLDSVELDGLDRNFVEHLPREGQKISLRIDKPTYQMIKQFCTVSQTREKVWLAYNNRAYPANQGRLVRIIELQLMLAQYTGFESYTQSALIAKMGQQVHDAEMFLNELSAFSQPKYERELEWLRKRSKLNGVTGKDGLFNPWDIGHLVKLPAETPSTRQRISEYFPAEQTIKKILSVFGQFLGISFKIEPFRGSWHFDVIHLGVYDKSGLLRGHLLLDLYPRKYKPGNSRELTFLSSESGEVCDLGATIGVIITNFPPKDRDKPSLLQISDVRTFLHEFGHVVSALFRAPEKNGFMGKHMSAKFREINSELFEEWLSEPEFLKAISSHYQTGQPLDDRQVERLCKSGKSWSGRSIQRKIGLSRLCLDCYASGPQKDPDQLVKDMYKNYLYGLCYDDRAHPIYAFGHLVSSNYGPLYYSYLWARVVACDLFAELKRRGLTNPETGAFYAKTVLARDKNRGIDQALRDFLGRDPNSQAFNRRMGF